MIQFDEHIFQMGWFNHQLVLRSTCAGRMQQQKRLTPKKLAGP